VYVLSFFGFLFWYVPVCVFRDKRRARRERKREEEVVGKNLSTRHLSIHLLSMRTRKNEEDEEEKEKVEIYTSGAWRRAREKREEENQK